MVESRNSTKFNENENPSNTNPGDATGWVDSGNGGVNGGASGQSAFADNGANTGAVAFIQGANILAQTVTSTTGTPLFLTFNYNTRSITATGNIDPGVELVFGGTPTVTNIFMATNVTTVGGNNPYYSSGTIAFNAPANSFELRFVGQNVVDDRTLLIDNVVLDTVPEPSAALLSALGVLAILRRRRA